MRAQETLLQVQAVADFALHQLQQTFNLPAFTYADIWNVFYGFIEGGVDVLPATSLISYCKGNASSMP